MLDRMDGRCETVTHRHELVDRGVLLQQHLNSRMMAMRRQPRGIDLEVAGPCLADVLHLRKEVASVSGTVRLLLAEVLEAMTEHPSDV